MSDVAWGQLDYLVVDTPPGTSDEHMAALDALRPYSPLGALLVTTPQVLGSTIAFSRGLPHPGRHLSLLRMPISLCHFSPGR